ncbi:MAG: UpxY family transcription antiterminator [Bacteroidia bacterium]
MDSNNLNNSNNWYAIYTKPRTEKKVYERMLLKGYNAYLPLVTSIREWSDRKKKVVTPLISGYVFVNINKDNLFETMNIQGTLGVLRYLGKPAIVREEEIENLKILLNDTENFCELKNVSFEKGEQIEVVNGLFKGLKGYSVNIQGKHRIIVEVEAIGSRLAVNVPLDFVRKLAVLDSVNI